MGKNRNKKLRNITVDGNDYKWLVETIEDGNYVRIWVNKNTILYKGIIYTEAVTPSEIAEIINETNWEIETK